MQQEETERYRTEVELLQRTLVEQESNSRKEVDDLQSYAKLTQGNSERQLREFKAQLTMKGKDLMQLRHELNEAEMRMQGKDREVILLKGHIERLIQSNS